LGRIKAAQGDFKGAEAALKRALEIDPEFRGATYYLGTVSLLKGDSAAARKVFMQLSSPYGLAMAEYDLGHRAEADKALDQLIAMHAIDAAYSVAAVYAWRGDRDQAFAWLGRAVAQRDNEIVSLKYDPLLRRLRSDPRYPLLLEKLGLPP
jgi:tetratricopeptide (TPR) repeat protein